MKYYLYCAYDFDRKDYLPVNHMETLGPSDYTDEMIRQIIKTIKKGDNFEDLKIYEVGYFDTKLGHFVIESDFLLDSRQLKEDILKEMQDKSDDEVKDEV